MICPRFEVRYEDVTAPTTHFPWEMFIFRRYVMEAVTFSYAFYAFVAIVVSHHLLYQTTCVN